MSVLSIGIDIVKIRRISDLLSRRGLPRFAAKILSDEERHALSTRPHPAALAAHLAGRWAAKEAAYKALRPLTGPDASLSFRELSIVESIGGVPHLHLMGNVLRLARARGVHTALVSIAHEEDMALAQVLLLGESPRRDDC